MVNFLSTCFILIICTVNPTLKAVAPKHIYNAEVGQTVLIGGNPIVDPIEPIRMRYYNDKYGYFYAHANYRNTGIAINSLKCTNTDTLFQYQFKRSSFHSQVWEQ